MMRGLATVMVTRLIHVLGVALLMAGAGRASAGEYVVTDDPDIKFGPIATQPVVPTSGLHLPTHPTKPSSDDFVVAEVAPDETWSTVTVTDGCTGTSCADPQCSCRAIAPVPDVINQPGLIQGIISRKETPWTVRADTILMWRNAPRDRPLFSTIIPNTALLGPTALNANQLQSDPLAAPRVSLFLGDKCQGSMEATYLYAGNFYSQRSLAPLLNAYATSPPGIFGNVWGPNPNPLLDTSLSSASATLIGTLQSMELSGRTATSVGASQFLFGFRWLQWYERLNMTDGFVHQPPPPGAAIVGQDNYLSSCTNNLFGGQIGLDTLLLASRSGIRVEGLVKAGAYCNVASQASSFSYADTAPFAYSRDISIRSPVGASFVGEAGLTAVVPLSHGWDFRCGYFGLWLEGLAQPVNQLSKQVLNQVDPPSGVLDLTGALVLQGVSLGLEGRW